MTDYIAAANKVVENSERLRRFINTTGGYTADTGAVFETAQDMLNRKQTELEIDGQAIIEQAEAARDTAISAADASGIPIAVFFEDKAAANTGLAGLTNGDWIEVASDESATPSGSRTRYEKVAGVYEFRLNLDQLRVDLNAGDGTTRVGFMQAGTGAVARTADDKLKEWVTVQDFGAVGDDATDDYLAFDKAATFCALTRTTLIIPPSASPYRLGTRWDLSNKLISVRGMSAEKCVLNAPNGILMSNSTTDGGDTCEVLENLTLVGDYSAGKIGIDQSKISRATKRNLIVCGYETGIKELNTFCNLSEMVETKDCKINWHLAGSNHNSLYSRCGAVGFGDSFGGVGTALLITNLGADSLQSNLRFESCDFEFGSGDATDITATGTVTFDDCYMESVGGAMFRTRGGNVVARGGEFIIKDSTGFLVDSIGGTMIFTDRASITSDGVTRLYPCLIKAGGGGRVVFDSSDIFAKLLTTNQGSIVPVLGRNNIGVPFLKASGRSFGWNPFTGNGSRVDTNDNMRVTCTVAGDIGIYQQMSTQPFIGRNCLLLIRYRSTTSVSITVTAGGGQVGPLTLLGTLPSSSGTLNIYCIPIAKITDPLQTWMEFWKTGWLVGEYVELEEVLFVDSGAIDNGRLSF